MWDLCKYTTHQRGCQSELRVIFFKILAASPPPLRCTWLETCGWMQRKEKKNLFPPQNNVASCWGHIGWMEPQIVYEWGWFRSEWGEKVATSPSDLNCITSVVVSESSMTGCEFLEIFKANSKKIERFISLFFFLSRCVRVCVCVCACLCVCVELNLPQCWSDRSCLDNLQNLNSAAARSRRGSEAKPCKG